LIKTQQQANDKTHIKLFILIKNGLYIFCIWGNFLADLWRCFQCGNITDL